jgi:phosphate transport system permease protein
MRESNKRVADRITLTWVILASAIVFLIPFFLLSALVIKSLPFLMEHELAGLITGSEFRPLSGIFGFAPFILGSLYVTLLSMALAVPLCLLSSLYLTYFEGRRFLPLVQPALDILAGIPSVVYGIWGVIAIVPAVRGLADTLHISSTGYSLLAASVVLAIMIIPFIMNMMTEILKTVPPELHEVTLSLGATRWIAVKRVIIRKAMPGLISSVFLGLARAFGETMAVLMVAGCVVQIPASLFDGAFPLPALIALNYSEMLSIPGYDAALMFAALLLLLIVLLFNTAARISIRYWEKQAG